jgi:hypothetical protein
MAKLKPKQKAWVVGFHVFFAGTWVGAAICLILVLFLSQPDSGDALHAFNMSAKIIDDVVIIPAAIGSLITGLLISWFTNWGFFRYKWVTVKWVLTVASMIFGTFWLGPWLNGMEAISAAERIQALQNDTYLHYQQMNAIFGRVQLGSLIFMVFISVLKPWKKWKQP